MSKRGRRLHGRGRGRTPKHRGTQEDQQFVQYAIPVRTAHKQAHIPHKGKVMMGATLVAAIDRVLQEPRPDWMEYLY